MTNRPIAKSPMSQSVDDMSQNKIVTNRPSTKKNCNKSSIHFGTNHSFFVTYRLGQMPIVTNSQLSQVTYVPDDMSQKVGETELPAMWHRACWRYAETLRCTRVGNVYLRTHHTLSAPCGC